MVKHRGGVAVGTICETDGFCWQQELDHMAEHRDFVRAIVVDVRLAYARLVYAELQAGRERPPEPDWSAVRAEAEEAWEDHDAALDDAEEIAA